MKNIYLSPLKPIFLIIFIGGLGFFADIAQLTNINIVKIFKENYPHSLIHMITLLLILYLVMVILNLRNSKQPNTSEEEDSNFQQKDDRTVRQEITSEKVEGSTIKMAGRDLNENNRND